jgi:hypothetical protein
MGVPHRKLCKLAKVKSKSKPKMKRRTPIPAAVDALVKPPSKEMLMSGGRYPFPQSRAMSATVTIARPESE